MQSDSSCAAYLKGSMGLGGVRSQEGRGVKQRKGGRNCSEQCWVSGGLPILDTWQQVGIWRPGPGLWRWTPPQGRTRVTDKGNANLSSPDPETSPWFYKRKSGRRCCHYDIELQGSHMIIFIVELSWSLWFMTLWLIIKGNVAPYRLSKPSCCKYNSRMKRKRSHLWMQKYEWHKD